MNTTAKRFSALAVAIAAAACIPSAFADTEKQTLPEPYEPGNTAVQSWNIHKISKAECKATQKKEQSHEKAQKHA
jgi:hypothetical protein